MVRNLSIDLSPAILQDEGLSEALLWLAEQMQKLYGLVVSIQTNGISTRFEDTLRILLFQAVRETLFNVVKHAETQHAAITLERADSLIHIIVSDNGVGFPPGSIDIKNGRGGLAHIQRRINLMGCHLHVESQPSGGSRVIIQVPAELAAS